MLKLPVLNVITLPTKTKASMLRREHTYIYFIYFSDDEVITRRLITQSFSIERVKEKIDNFYTTRHKMPEILRDRDPLAPTLNKCLRQGYWVVLPKRTPDNKRVTILR